MNGRISVLLADDHAVLRRALTDWLRKQQDVTIAGETNNAEEAARLARQLQPDVVVLDIDMPGLLSFDAARTIRNFCPDTSIIFLSAFFHDRYIEQALAVEARGYVVKGEPPESVLQAIRAVASGGSYFSPEVQSRILFDTSGPRVALQYEGRAVSLTPREMEVLRYLARGLAKKEIAGIMHISMNTVNRHATSLMAKLDIHDRVELARYAIREGLAEA